MSHRSIARLVALVPFVALLAAACDSSSNGPFPPAPPLASITVSATSTTLPVTTSQQFTAVGKDANGNVVAFTPVWGIVAGGGSISSSGLVTAGTVAATFTNTVKASGQGISGVATITVTAGPLATIDVTPAASSPLVLATQAFAATGKDAYGNPVTITPAWSIVAGGGAINAVSGLFTAGAVPGTFASTVKATSGTVSGFATVSVLTGVLATITISPSPAITSVAATQQFTAIGRDASGNLVTFTPAWTVVAGGGAINGATGLFTAGAVPGTFTNTVRAASGTVSSLATVTVTSGVLASITISPSPASVPTNGTQQFTAVGRDASNNIIPFTPTWSNVNTTAGTISSAGLFTAGLTAGVYTNTVTAASGAISATATVTVTAPGGLATIIIIPNPASLNPNGTQVFTASGRDVNGVATAISPAPTWSVAVGGGTINSISGLFLAGAATGVFTNTIKATSGLVSGFASVVINSAAPPLIPLGNAAPNGIMAGTAVTCITGGLISADVSISPGNTVTGFGPCVITGVQHLADAVALNGQNDLTTAYNLLQALPCPPANAIVADLGGTTKAAGVYCTASGIGVTGVLTLDGGGDPNANFVFQAGTSIITAGDVVLINGAQARNVYWVSGSSVTLGTASQWKGNVIALTSITLVDTANLIGRALARNGAVTLGTANTITLP